MTNALRIALVDPNDATRESLKAMLLGLAIPVDLLGVYSIGFALAVLPLTLARMIANSVVFPLYRMKHPLDASQNQAKIFKARRMVAGAALVTHRPEDVAEDAPWVGYEPRMHYLPHAAAIARVAEKEGLSAVSVNDAETLFHMVCMGHGKTLLPRVVGQADPRLVEVPFGHGPLPERELWLMIRKELRDLERIRLVVAWLERVFATVSS